MREENIDVEEKTRRSVYAIWQELLVIDREAFEPNKGFIASGGYSLLGLRLIDALTRQLGVKLELSDFLGDLSASALADRVISAFAEEATASTDDGAEHWEEGYI